MHAQLERHVANSTSKESGIKNQPAGRRLSGNQQQELTREETKHPQRVESTAEDMQEAEKRRDKGKDSAQ